MHDVTTSRCLNICHLSVLLPWRPNLQHMDLRGQEYPNHNTPSSRISSPTPLEPHPRRASAPLQPGSLSALDVCTHTSHVRAFPISFVVFLFYSLLWEAFFQIPDSNHLLGRGLSGWIVAYVPEVHLPLQRAQGVTICCPAVVRTEV